MVIRPERRISHRISWRDYWRMYLWSRGLPVGVVIEAQTVWPLVLLPFALFGQLVTPHPVWVALLTSIVGVYAIGYAWVREQVQGVRFTRRRIGAILVAGDALQEEFVVSNQSGLPLLWVAFVDASDLPGYAPGVVVACGAHSEYRWKTEAVCERRAVGLLTASGDEVITLAPQPGQAQLWAILAALTPAQPSATPLHALLQRSLPLLGRRHTLVVVTPSLGEGAPLWIAERVRAGRQGLFSSVLAVAAPEQSAQADECLALLTRLDIPHQFLRTDLRLRTALTYRRRRKVIRTTPTGDAFTVEVEEEVG